jgi:hypothetical protein
MTRRSRPDVLVPSDGLIPTSGDAALEPRITPPGVPAGRW